MTSSDPDARGRWICPTCGKAGTEDTRPFCSARCANLNLGRWFDGSYILNGGERVESEGTGEK